MGLKLKKVFKNITRGLGKLSPVPGIARVISGPSREVEVAAPTEGVLPPDVTREIAGLSPSSAQEFSEAVRFAREAGVPEEFISEAKTRATAEGARAAELGKTIPGPEALDTQARLVSGIAQQLRERAIILGQAKTERGKREALRKERLATIPRLQEELGQQLLTQEQQAFERLRPRIEERLSALGLLQSGALPEAQARSQRELEESRQARLGEFGISARAQTELDLPQEQLESELGLLRSGLQREFGLGDILRQEALQSQLSSQALQEARRSRGARRRSARRASLGGLIGTGLGVGAGFLGGTALAPTLVPALGGLFGGLGGLFGGGEEE